MVGAAPGAPQGARYGDSKVSNGPLDESGIHDFDFMRYTLDEVKFVTASARKVEGTNYEITIAGAAGKAEILPFLVDRGKGSWFDGQMSNFLASIRDEESPRGTAEDGYKTQQIVMAAFESPRTGRRVEVDGSKG